MSEILIVLAVLGVVSAFTIPKVLEAQANHRNIAVTKELVGAFSQAFQQLQLRNGVSTRTMVSDMVPFFNAASMDNAATIDNLPIPMGTFGVGSTITCGAGSNRCVRFQNGALMMYDNGASFSPGLPPHRTALPIIIDPDGQANGRSSIGILQYYSGNIRTYGSAFGTSAATSTQYTSSNPPVMTIVLIFGTSPATHDPSLVSMVKEGFDSV